MGTKVVNGDEVRVDGGVVRNGEESWCIWPHKPVGIVCTTDTKRRRIISLITLVILRAFSR